MKSTMHALHVMLRENFKRLYLQLVTNLKNLICKVFSLYLAMLHGAIMILQLPARPAPATTGGSSMLYYYKKKVHTTYYVSSK
jgi:hypothetical protein